MFTEHRSPDADIGGLVKKYILKQVQLYFFTGPMGHTTLP